MSKSIKRLLLVFEILVAVLLSAGCPGGLLSTGTPPYSITTPACRMAGPDDQCSVGGVFFDFLNKSEKEVIFIETCMNIFNLQSGQLAFAGAGGLSCRSSCSIPVKQTKKLCIPLDEYLWQMDFSQLCIDNFFIRRIEYADGTSWQDNFGVYAISVLQEA